MTFSEVVKACGVLVNISRDSVYIASSSHNKLTVRLCKTLEVIRVYTCVDVIHNFSWSCDSSFILCVLKKSSMVQVLSIENQNWNCKVDEGSGGLISASWVPETYYFLTKTQLNLRITLWSISDVSISYLKYPKTCPNNLAFSPGGRYMALLERRDFRDHLSIMDCKNSFAMLRNLQLATDDACGLLWSPDGRYLAVWDDCLRYRLVVHSVDGQHLCTYSAYSQYEGVLGIKSVSWSPTGQLLAIGSYDQRCRILNHINWNCLACLPHPTDKLLDHQLGIGPAHQGTEEAGKECGDSKDSRIPPREEGTVGPSRGFTVYREERGEVNQTGSIGAGGAVASNSLGDVVVAYRLVSESINIISTKPDPKLPNPKIGIGMMAFSPDSRFLATRNDSAAHVAWLWCIDHRLGLYNLLVHTSGPIIQWAWDPGAPARLAICNGSDCVFIWTPKWCRPIRTPRSFKLKVTGLSWLPTGGVLLLLSESGFCFCYLALSESVGESDVNQWNAKHHLAESACTIESIRLDDLRLEEPVSMTPALPIGSFGTASDSADGPVLTGSHTTLGDTPNWLRHRMPTDHQGNDDQNLVSFTCDPKRTVGSPKKTNMLTESFRQAWSKTLNNTQFSR